MATTCIRIGSADNIVCYDDGDFDSAIETDQPIKAGTPVDPDDVVRLEDLGTMIWPIGSVFLSIVATNPADLLGFGTWVRIAEGQFLVGFKTADADFDPVENTGGSKTHKHSVNVPNTTSGGPSATETVDKNEDGVTATVASDDHTHDVDPAPVDSGDNNALPPFFVIYAWKRTA